MCCPTVYRQRNYSITRIPCSARSLESSIDVAAPHSTFRFVRQLRDCFFYFSYAYPAKSQTSAIVGFAPLQWILALTLVGLPVVLAVERLWERLLRRVSDPKPDEQAGPHALTVALRWSLVVAVVGFDCWFFLDFYSSMSGTKPWLGITYIALSLILGLLISTVYLYERRQETLERRRAVLVLSSTLIGPFLYVIVLAFAYGVFPNIPSTRGAKNSRHSTRSSRSFIAHSAIYGWRQSAGYNTSHRDRRDILGILSCGSFGSRRANRVEGHRRKETGDSNFEQGSDYRDPCRIPRSQQAYSLMLILLQAA
jgi:hypothetical protein